MFTRIVILVLIITTSLFAISFTAINADAAHTPTQTELARPFDIGPCMQSWCFEVARPADIGPCYFSWCMDDAVARPVDMEPCYQAYCIIEQAV